MTLAMPVLAVTAVLLVALGWWLAQVYGPLREATAAAVDPLPLPIPAVFSADSITIDALADPVLIVAGDRAIAANAPARALFGARVEGGDLRMAVRHPGVLETIAQARSGGITIEREITGIGQGNSAYRVRAVDAGEGRTLVTFADITQARLTERMRVDFVANASHELRTPLATLSGFIETLQGPAADDEPARSRFLDIMAREAGRMSRLIDDLLSLSRIELDKHVRPQAVLDLPGLIADVGKTLAMRLDSDERQLVIEEAADLPPVVADRDQVLQVLHNLISNALKYGRSGSPITVSAVAEPAHGGEPATVLLTVLDQSEGIAPEHLPRLTERFYRVDSLRSRRMGGTGLGLAIVKHIVERHRGKLEIDSRPGEGTRVSFTLIQADPATIEAFGKSLETAVT